MAFQPEERRSELGLPPLISRRQRIFFGIFAITILPLVVGGVGWAIGTLYRGTQMQTLQKEFNDAVQLEPTALAQAIPEIETTAANLSGNIYTHLLMADLYAFAARRLPSQQMYNEQALRDTQKALQLAKADSTIEPVALMQLYSQEAGLLQDLGHDREAIKASEHAMKMLKKVKTKLPDTKTSTAKKSQDAALASLRITLLNSHAYLLASAKDVSKSEALKALVLAKEVIASPQPQGGRFTSDIPPYLDTLAEAYFATGDAKQALMIQKRALALAKGEELAIYLVHYDKYLAAAKE